MVADKDRIETFTDLRAWREGHELVLMVYKLTKGFPDDEQFGLVSQMRRAAVSVTSNIAEGFSRKTYKEKIRFYFMSLGSVTELQNQLLVARDVGYVGKEKFELVATKTVDVYKIIKGLIKGADKYAEK